MKRSSLCLITCKRGTGGVNLPSPYFLSQFLSSPYFLFPHPGPSSSILPTPKLSFSPSSLLFPPISPSFQLFLGYFSLLPILFLPPLATWTVRSSAALSVWQKSRVSLADRPTDAAGQFKQAAMRRSNRNFNIPPPLSRGKHRAFDCFMCTGGGNLICKAFVSDLLTKKKSLQKLCSIFERMHMKSRECLIKY